jgi:hypothetical protein
MSHTYLLSVFDHNNIWRGLQIMEFLIIKLSPSFCFYLFESTFCSVFCSQTLSVYVLPSWWENKFHAYKLSWYLVLWFVVVFLKRVEERNFTSGTVNISLCLNTGIYMFHVSDISFQFKASYLDVWKLCYIVNIWVCWLWMVWWWLWFPLFLRDPNSFAQNSPRMSSISSSLIIRKFTISYDCCDSITCNCYHTNVWRRKHCCGLTELKWSNFTCDIRECLSVLHISTEVKAIGRMVVLIHATYAIEARCNTLQYVLMHCPSERKWNFSFH